MKRNKFGDLLGERELSLQWYFANFVRIIDFY